MRFFRLLLVLLQIGSLGARTAPIRRYEANIVPVAIAQDREGVLWLATTSGVVRFDGLRFEAVQAPAGIDLSRTTDISAAPDGSIWIGTAKGLIRYRGGSFAMVLPGEIKSLLITRAGRILTSAGVGAIFHTALHLDPDPIRWSRPAGAGG
jgi:ligand-binding sensor domain-containing protein